MYVVVGLGKHCLKQVVRNTPKPDTRNGRDYRGLRRDVWSLEGILHEKFRENRRLHIDSCILV